MLTQGALGSELDDAETVRGVVVALCPQLRHQLCVLAVGTRSACSPLHHHRVWCRLLACGGSCCREENGVWARDKMPAHERDDLWEEKGGHPPAVWVWYVAEGPCGSAARKRMHDTLICQCMLEPDVGLLESGRCTRQAKPGGRGGRARAAMMHVPRVAHKQTLKFDNKSVCVVSCMYPRTHACLHNKICMRGSHRFWPRRTRQHLQNSTNTPPSLATYRVEAK